MKSIAKYFFLFGLALLMLSCGKGTSSYEKEAKFKSSADTITTNGFISSSSAVENGKDTSRKFIR
jgi:hypothetical protein